MSCDVIMNRVSEAITQGRVIDETVKAHLATCPRCAEEATELKTLWADLGALPMPAASSQKVAETVRLGQVLMTPSNRPPVPRGRLQKTWVTTVLVSLALVVGILIGWGLPNGSTRLAVSDGTQEAYLLLLHGTASTPPPEGTTPVRIADYRRWAQNLDDGGHLVTARKLTDDTGHWLAPSALPAERPNSLSITGYFIVRAEDYNEAVRLARSSPHLRHGGFIEVRAIENTEP